ncbi:DNA-binding protein C1D [Sugiyamaella lignohabitans]|uniref:DNA-binding protein C1D n=1 Tax=Sugiyamaella lignohabitans TaxID=796027 RepID=A0A167CQQ0_9ASCO|nr:DNA-binding protein C1D [Sugiyamaella lignohabitans]ANB11992.1 DNA-binding protein C1D [Sugiyamaella lignohabitans]
MNELERVKSYMNKVKEQTGEPVKKPQRARVVDKEAANRFIQNALSDSNDKTEVVFSGKHTRLDGDETKDKEDDKEGKAEERDVDTTAPKKRAAKSSSEAPPKKKSNKKAVVRAKKKAAKEAAAEAAASARE